MPDLELHLPPDIAYVGLARLVVTQAARQAGMEDERVEDLRIAVSEATTNAMVAHQHSSQGNQVVLCFGPDADSGFEVIIEDTGAGFQPVGMDHVATRDWQDENGLGVTLIRGLADDVDFVRGDGMRVHMRFAVGLSA